MSLGAFAALESVPKYSPKLSNWKARARLRLYRTHRAKKHTTMKCHGFDFSQIQVLSKMTWYFFYCSYRTVSLVCINAS